MPDELWTEVPDIVQETGSKTIPMEKKCKKAKWLSEEALQIAVKRREVKSKGEKERYKHMNAEFQRIARRDKKAFFSDQCKEIEENNRMGKTRGLFKKIRDTKGTFHAKMGSIKDRNGMDLTEAEDIKNTRRDLQLLGALEQRNFERRPQRGLRIRDGDAAHELRPLALEQRVVLDADIDIQVAARSPLLAGFAF